MHMKTTWNDDMASVVLRLTLAVIFVSHGYLKLAITDGYKWAPNLPPLVANLVAWGEVIGGLALAVGLLSRLAAVGLGIIQLGAIAVVTSHREFIGDLIPKQASELGMTFSRVGYEYNTALVAMCIAVALIGSGAFSLDHLLLN